VWDVRNGQCFEQFYGEGDMAAIAAGPANTRYRTLAGSTSARSHLTVVDDGQQRLPVAFFPGFLKCIHQDPKNRISIGIDAGYLCIITLEGGVEPPKVRRTPRRKSSRVAAHSAEGRVEPPKVRKAPMRKSPRAAAIPSQPGVHPVASLPDTGKPQEAVQIAEGASEDELGARNAVGLHLLRTGAYLLAKQTFAGIVLKAGTDTLEPRSPTVFKVNYASSLFLSGDVAECLWVLRQIDDEQDPGVQRLRAAIARWGSRLTAWQRILLKIGIKSGPAPEVDFPPGELK
jgi:hypothetical protein